MSIVHKSRVTLIRFAKLYPFLLCLLVFISMSEVTYAICVQDYVEFNGCEIPNTPIAWWIGRIYKINLYSVVVAAILSISFETCKWNKISVVFLFSMLLTNEYLSETTIDFTSMLFIDILFNFLSGFLFYKGLKIIVINKITKQNI